MNRFIFRIIAKLYALTRASKDRSIHTADFLAPKVKNGIFSIFIKKLFGQAANQT